MSVRAASRFCSRPRGKDEEDEGLATDPGALVLMVVQRGVSELISAADGVMAGGGAGAARVHSEKGMPPVSA